MDPKYLLQQLFSKTASMRKAQKDYYAYKGDLKTDRMKKALYEDARSKEQDVDNIMAQIRKLMPEVFNPYYRP